MICNLFLNITNNESNVHCTCVFYLREFATPVFLIPSAIKIDVDRQYLVSLKKLNTLKIVKQINQRNGFSCVFSLKKV